MEKNELEEKTIEYQKINEQLQSLAAQKDRLTMQKTEHKNAEVEITKAKGKVFSAVGSVIVEVTKEDAETSVKERAEMIELRLTVVNRQIHEFSEKEKKMRSELEGMLKNNQM
jgi:prefoldin beta subunit